MLGQDISCLNAPATTLDPPNLPKLLPTIYDWKCVLTGAPPTFFLGMGRSKNYMFDPTRRNWTRVPEELRFDLPPETIVIAEVIDEFRGEGKSMRRGRAVHIIDALIIAGEDLRSKYDLKFRNAILRAFVKSMAKPSHPSKCFSLALLLPLFCDHKEKAF